MKRILIAGCTLLTVNLAQAQQKEGTVVYQRISQMQIRISGMNEQMQNMLPKSRTDKFELTFGNNQSLWKAAEPDNEEEGFGIEGSGIQIRMPGFSSDVLYSNLETGEKVEQKELFDKKFIIDDSISKMKWKMTGETKTILNYTCMKATAIRVSPRPQTTMINGKLERTETMDTLSIVAWFTSDIPVSTGPGEYQGQLPGLILEMDISNGRMIYKAVEVRAKADLAIIKKPTGKKRCTREEFNKERDKMLAEMQRNNGGGNSRTIIRTN